MGLKSAENEQKIKKCFLGIFIEGSAKQGGIQSTIKGYRVGNPPS